MSTDRPKHRPSHPSRTEDNACRNHLKQQFSQDAPNLVWVSDFTYIKAGGKWCYLCVVIDLFSRKVVSWQLSDKADTALVMNAFRKAYEKRGRPQGLMFHSDRGTQYTAEPFRKLLDEAQAGDNVGALLRGIDRKDIEKGQVIAKPGSIHPHTEFEAQVYVLTKEEGGRHTPFFNNYRPQFFIRTTDVTGSIKLPEGVEMVMPGDNVKIDVSLIKPVAVEEGLRFAIREGGRTVGSGVVSKIVK